MVIVSLKCNENKGEEKAKDKGEREELVGTEVKEVGERVVPAPNPLSFEVGCLVLLHSQDKLKH